MPMMFFFFVFFFFNLSLVALAPIIVNCKVELERDASFEVLMLRVGGVPCPSDGAKHRGDEKRREKEK